LALKVGSNLLNISAKREAHIWVVRAAIESVKSDQITGSSLDALVEFFTACAKKHVIDKTSV
jgi:hypothetical protein